MNNLLLLLNKKLVEQSSFAEKLSSRSFKFEAKRRIQESHCLGPYLGDINIQRTESKERVSQISNRNKKDMTTSFFRSFFMSPIFFEKLLGLRGPTITNQKSYERAGISRRKIGICIRIFNGSRCSGDNGNDEP